MDSGDQQITGKKQGRAENLTNAGKGRPKGTPNKSTATMKAAIISVYEALQAKYEEPHGHFLAWAETEPSEFYKLAAKLIPLQVTGEDGGAIVHEVRRVITDPAQS